MAYTLVLQQNPFHCDGWVLYTIQFHTVYDGDDDDNKKVQQMILHEIWNTLVIKLKSIDDFFSCLNALSLFVLFSNFCPTHHFSISLCIHVSKYVYTSLHIFYGL